MKKELLLMVILLSGFVAAEEWSVGPEKAFRGEASLTGTDMGVDWVSGVYVYAGTDAKNRGETPYLNLVFDLPDCDYSNMDLELSLGNHKYYPVQRFYDERYEKFRSAPKDYFSQVVTKEAIGDKLHVWLYSPASFELKDVKLHFDASCAQEEELEWVMIYPTRDGNAYERFVDEGAYQLLAGSEWGSWRASRPVFEFDLTQLYGKELVSVEFKAWAYSISVTGDPTNEIVLEEVVDFSFDSEVLESHGVFSKPGDGDKWHTKILGTVPVWNDKYVLRLRNTQENFSQDRFAMGYYSDNAHKTDVYPHLLVKYRETSDVAVPVTLPVEPGPLEPWEGTLDDVPEELPCEDLECKTEKEILMMIYKLLEKIAGVIP